jgi:hypothetical protein
VLVQMKIAIECRCLTVARFLNQGGVENQMVVFRQMQVNDGGNLWLLVVVLYVGLHKKYSVA